MSSRLSTPPLKSFYQNEYTVKKKAKQSEPSDIGRNTQIPNQTLTDI
jgi:hypothetical protein